MSKWVYQREGYGIGNFVMLTTAIAARNEPTDVYFHDPAIASLYHDCPLINILAKKPKSEPWNNTGLPYRRHGESDYQAWWRRAGGEGEYKCVPCDIKYNPESETVALVHGCHGLRYRRMKDVGKDVRDSWLTHAREPLPLIIGTYQDHKWYWKHNTLPARFMFGAPLRTAVEIMFKCKYFISNDTGLAHLAAASGMPGIVFWNDTDFIKNGVPTLKNINVRDWDGKYPNIND